MAYHQVLLFHRVQFWEKITYILRLDQDFAKTSVQKVDIVVLLICLGYDKTLCASFLDEKDFKVFNKLPRQTAQGRDISDQKLYLFLGLRQFGVGNNLVVYARSKLNEYSFGTSD